MTLPVSLAEIESLVPHRPPMCWIESLLDCTETEAKGTVSFSKTHFAVNDGRVAESALVECMAQIVAAAAGYRSRLPGGSGKPAGGMLAAVSSFMIHKTPPFDTVIEITVTQRKRLGPMLLVSGKMLCGGEVIATGELSLYA